MLSCEVDRVLRRVACRRTGHDDIGAAFAPPELGRLRTVLDQAFSARGQRLSRRRSIESRERGSA